MKKYDEKIKFFGGRYRDNNKNTWDGTKFTGLEALKASDSLINCRQCIDCVNCTNCVNCIDCDNCTDCIECINCVECTDLKNCSNCKKLQNSEFIKAIYI